VYAKDLTEELCPRSKASQKETATRGFLLILSHKHMKLMRYLDTLCTPALAYLILAGFGALGMAFSLRDPARLAMLKGAGNAITYFIAPTTLGGLLSHLVYVAALLMLLQALCVHGHSRLSWAAMILIPMVMMSIAIDKSVIRAVMAQQKKGQ